MHSIIVPADVTLADPVTDEPFADAKPVSFKAFVLGALLADDRWRKDLEQIETALKVRAAVRAFGNHGDKLVLEDADFAKLKECAERPTAGYPRWDQKTPQHWAPVVLPQLAPFLLAIKDGKKE